MIFNRVWAMPNKWTFEIKPIRHLIYKYGGEFKGWIDPFSGMHSPAEFTNDLNPEMPTKYHLEASEFIDLFEENNINGCLFDPPYSMEQISRSYNKIGLKDWQNKNKAGKSGSFAYAKQLLSLKIKRDGYCISFGWNSSGIGKKRGFEIVEILLVAHGGGHNDTIITVEKNIA